MERAGTPIDRRLAESAALLHDVDKLATVKPEVDGFRHADGAAAWLSARGYSELATVIACHPVTRLADGEWFESWYASASPEALVVWYSDKRAGQRLESMADRFASWTRRYPPEERTARARGGWTVETVALVRSRSEEIERRVCRLADTRPEEVRRLRWTGTAMSGSTR